MQIFMRCLAADPMTYEASYEPFDDFDNTIWVATSTLSDDPDEIAQELGLIDCNFEILCGCWALAHYRAALDLLKIERDFTTWNEMDLSQFISHDKYNEWFCSLVGKCFGDFAGSKQRLEIYGII